VNAFEAQLTSKNERKIFSMAAAAAATRKSDREEESARHITIDVQTLLEYFSGEELSEKDFRLVRRNLKNLNDVAHVLLESLTNAEEEAIVADAKVRLRDEIAHTDDIKYRTRALQTMLSSLQNIVQRDSRPSRTFVETFNSVIILARQMKPVIDLQDVNVQLNRDVCVCDVDEAHALFDELKYRAHWGGDMIDYCTPEAWAAFDALGEVAVAAGTGAVEVIDTSEYDTARRQFDGQLNEWREKILATEAVIPTRGQFARVQAIMDRAYPVHDISTRDKLMLALGELKLWKSDIDILSLAHQFMTGTLRAIVRIRRKDDVRPIVTKELGSDTLVHVGAGAAGGRSTQAFHVFGPEESTESVYSQIEPFVTTLVMGGDVFLMATGQTGSGKTYTMKDIKRRVFKSIAAMMSADDRKSSRIMIGGVEIHCGLDSDSMVRTPTNVRDLLSDNEDVHVRYAQNDSERRSAVYSCSSAHYEHLRDGLRSPLLTEGITLAEVDLSNLAAYPDDDDDDDEAAARRRVTDQELAAALSSLNPFQILSVMNRKRARRSTAMNPESSRSHMVVTLFYQKLDPTTGRYQNFGFLHLIDLAGSEQPLPLNLEQTPISRVVMSMKSEKVSSMAEKVRRFRRPLRRDMNDAELVNDYVMERTQGQVINESLTSMRNVVSGWVRRQTSRFQNGQPIVNLLLRAQSLERNPQYVTTGRVMFICCLSPDQLDESNRTLEIVKAATLQTQAESRRPRPATSAAAADRAAAAEEEAEEKAEPVRLGRRPIKGGINAVARRHPSSLVGGFLLF